MDKMRDKLHGKGQMSDWKRKRIQVLTLKISITFLIVLAAAFGLFYQMVHKVPEHKIANNIYIGEVNVSEMTKKKASLAVESKLEEYRQQTLTVEIGEESVDVLLEELGIGVKDVDKLIDQAIGYGKKGSTWKRFGQLHSLKKNKKVFDENFVIDKKLTETVLQEKVVPLEQTPVDATITSTEDGFEITDEAAGMTLSIEDSIKMIRKYLNEEWDYKNAKIKLVEEETAPRITRADLEKIEDRLGSFRTDAGGGERVQNLKRAAELINGTVLLPGEEMSVQEKTLPYTEENGYVSGSAYENGEVVQNIGGGLCQVSTTLYNAALYSELEVTSRAAHSMIVHYVDPSMDAAIAEGSKDLKIVNPYDDPIMIEGFIDSSNRLTFIIYGKESRPENRSIRFESETLEVTPIKTKFVEDPDSSIGSMEKDGSAFEGSKARLWKIVYVDDVEVSRDVINNSNYRATDRIMKVGTASDSSEASALVKNAIASQDEAAIRSAIDQANALLSGDSEEESTDEEVSEESSEEE